MECPGFIRNSIYVVFFILLFDASVGYATGNTGVGSRSIGMAGASVSLSDPFAVFNNQAGLARLNNISISSFYQQRGIAIGYSDMAGVFCLPLSAGNFAFSYLQTGISGYHESRAGISFAKSLSPVLSAGLQFNYFMIDIPEASTSKGTVVFEGGVQYSFGKGISVGVHVFNPFGAKIETLYNEKIISSTIKCGAGFTLGKNLLLVSEAVFTNNFPFNARMAFEYTIAEKIFLRGGISGMPLSNFYGAGYKWKNITADLAFSRQKILGYSPSVSLNYTF